MILSDNLVCSVEKMCAEVIHDTGLMLPAEVLEMVFSQLPLIDLLTTVATVCHRWSEVIMNPAFIPWKKLYYQFKLAPSSFSPAFLLSSSRMGEKLKACDIITMICELHGLTSLRNCLTSVVRLMGSTQRLPADDATKLALQNHHLYTVSVETLENMEEAILPRPFNVWHITTMIVLLSHDVWHVDALLQLLLYEGSIFTPCNVTEAFYCLALMFFYCTKKFELPTRYHYIVYHALYLFENRWAALPVDLGKIKQEHVGQQSLHKYIICKTSIQHTHEQMRIINHNIQPNDIVKIVAFAGTGKTSTLLQICKQQPHQRFLLIVYNKSVAEHCAKTFPNNVKVKTAHAMAYASVGRRYSAVHKLEGSLKARMITKFLEKKDQSGNRFRRAALVTETVEKFINSASDYITLQHVPRSDRGNVSLDDDFRLKILLRDAESVWEEMKRCSHSQKISMSQDGQLKVWQLKKPKLQGYDVIMIDEGQDMNAAMFDIFLNQNCAKVVVGDPYQQIYSFRGAVNALNMVTSTHTFYLTQSFRFGPEISYIAHCVLESLLRVNKWTIVGGRKKDMIKPAPTANKYYISKKKIRRAYLSRTNLELYKTAVAMCLDDTFSSLSMTFAGGIEKYGYDVVVDIYKLSQVEKGYGTAETLGIKNKLVAKFERVIHLRNYAENLDDHELYNKIVMYQYSNDQTLTHINLLKKRCSAGSSVADITFSTIHRAKGLEWDWVILLDDIQPINILFPSLRTVDVGDEYNLMYVAITRAKWYLTINSAVLYTLVKARDKLEVLVSRKSVEETTKCLQCAAEGVANTKSSLVTKVQSISLLWNENVFPGGYLCNACATFDKFVPPLTFRHREQRISFLQDCSRIARLMLITGGQNFNGPENSGAMEKGWHQYSLRQHMIPLQERVLHNEAVGPDDDDDVDFFEGLGDVEAFEAEVAPFIQANPEVDQINDEVLNNPQVREVIQID